MKRMMMLCTAAATCALSAAAWGGDWFDSFDSYACESQIVGQGGWEFWTGGADPGTARVSCATDGYPVYAGDKSLRIQGTANSTGDDIVHTYSFVNSGFWGYTAWQYIPADASGGTTFFILLNEYPTSSNASWSVVLQMDPTAGTVVSQSAEGDAPPKPLALGRWAEIKVLIDLDADLQTIFYDDLLLDSKTWTGGWEPGGLLNVGAVDLWSDSLANVPVFYDEMSLVELPAQGACCLDTGECLDDTTPADCDAAGGRYMNSGSSCEAVDCPVYGACGWELMGPMQFSYTTIGQGDTCDFVGNSEDEQFTVEIPFTGEWSFSLCGGADWDTVLAFDPDECCGFAEFDDNGCPSGFQSLLHFPELAAGTYYLNLEDVSGQNGGEYTLTIDTPCIIDCPDGGVAEQEPCGDDTNGGCNMDTPAFEDIFLDTPICGKAYYDGSTRDTDWYEYEAPGAQDLVFSGSAEFICVIGIIQYNEGSEGSGSCDDISGYISPFTSIGECEENEVEVSIPVAGTYWFFVAPDFNNDVIQCGDEDGLENDYVVMLSEAGDDCPWDFDDNDVVNTADLLFLLGAWGTADGDVDGDGDTDTADLLALLAAWGECP